MNTLAFSYVIPAIRAYSGLAPVRQCSCRAYKKGAPTSYDVGAPRSTAATYSPNWCVSTIGARGLNCSVRYGKRWDPAAKATANIT